MLLLYVAVFVLVSFEPTLGQRRCAAGWESSASTMGGSVYDNCYFFYTFTSRTPALTYSQARAYCQDQGSTLLTFKDNSELNDFMTWMNNPNGGPTVQIMSVTFMLGYAYLKSANKVVYEGISGDVTNVFDQSASYYFAPSSPGALGNVIVLFNGSISNLTWGITEVDLSSIGSTSDYGFVCKRSVGNATCVKLNKPYLSSFGGRRIPIRPYSRYWLMRQNSTGEITIWTDSTKDLILDDLKPSTLPGAPPASVYPRHGPVINYVEYSPLFQQAVSGSGVVQFASRNYAVYRTFSAITGKYSWFSRVVLTNGRINTTPLSNTSISYTIDKSQYTINGKQFIETVQADWVRGGHFEGGWLVTTPTFRFFYDGVDIQVFSAKANFDNKERGLCDTVSKDQSDPFFNQNSDSRSTAKTTNLYSFIKGQLRSPQFSPTSAGRPLTCTSHALFESAIKACTVLIHPLSPLINGVGPTCFQMAVDIDNSTNRPFADLSDNIYQACVESVCAHGPSARCYYVEKLLSRMAINCSATSNNLGLSRRNANCSASSNTNIISANFTCTTQVGGPGILNNGICYLKNPGRVNLADALAECNQLGSQLPAPSALQETYLTGTLMQPSSNWSRGTWLGLIASMRNRVHALPFKKVVATDEALATYIRTATVPDTGSEQCMKIGTNGVMYYTSCTTDKTANVICSNVVSDPACTTDTCPYPNTCIGTTCTDPCPGSYESRGKCPIPFS